MWDILENKDFNKKHLYFEKITFVEHKHTFFFSSDLNNEYYKITIDGSAHSCRLIDSFNSAFYNDKYISKKDFKLIFSGSNIYYTNKSEYLDWFIKNSFPDSNDVILYHFIINAEDYIVEFITDELPRIEKVAVSEPLL